MTLKKVLLHFSFFLYRASVIAFISIIVRGPDIIVPLVINGWYHSGLFISDFPFPYTSTYTTVRLTCWCADPLSAAQLMYPYITFTLHTNGATNIYTTFYSSLYMIDKTTPIKKVSYGNFFLSTLTALHKSETKTNEGVLCLFLALWDFDI